MLGPKTITGRSQSVTTASGSTRPLQRRVMTDLESFLPKDRIAPPDATDGVTMWVIYRRPKDFPQGCVLRAQWAMRDGTVRADSLAWYCNDKDDDASIAELRNILPPGLFNL